MKKNKFQVGDIVLLRGDLGMVTCVYTPGVQYTDSHGSSHTLPKDSLYIYDVFYQDKKLSWCPAKESELKLVEKSRLPIKEDEKNEGQDKSTRKRTKSNP